MDRPTPTAPGPPAVGEPGAVDSTARGVLAPARDGPAFRGTGPLARALLLLVGLITFATGGGRPGSPLQWPAVALVVGLPLWWARRSGRSPAAPPTWALAAFLAAAAAVLVLQPKAGASVVLIVMGTSFGIQQLGDRPAVAFGASSLLLVLAASLRERLALGSDNGILTALVAYAVAFGALIASRQRQRRVAETERLLRELAAEHARLEEAHAALAQHARNVAALAASEERNRIAREIHDVLAHALTAMVVQAEAAAVRLRVDPGGAGEQVRAVADLARQALQEARLSVAAIRADPGAAGLDALRRLCDDAERWSGMRCVFTVEGPERPLPAAAALAAYRILQEALTNARRHGVARQVDVVVSFPSGGLVLAVADDGGAEQGAARDGSIGATVRRAAGDPEAGMRAGSADAAGREAGPLPGSGLRGMRERAEALGGRLEARPTPGGPGFVVRAFLPLPDASAMAEESGPPAGPTERGAPDPADPAVRPGPAAAGRPRGRSAGQREPAPRPARRGGAP